MREIVKKINDAIKRIEAEVSESMKKHLNAK